jgi:acetyl/propionyl-CoA carboxylase alpha subunit
MQAGMCTVSDDTHHFHIEDVQVFSRTRGAVDKSASAQTTQEQWGALRSTTWLDSSGRAGCGSIHLSLDGTPMSVFFAWEAHTFWLQHLGTQIKIVDQRLQSSAVQSVNAGNAIRAPMHGRIVQIEAVDNDSVSAGQLLVIMEAMKMEHHLLAPSDARIEQILVRAGDQVASGQILITIA